MFGRLLGLLLGDLLGRLGLATLAQGDVVVASTSVLDGVAVAGAHADGALIIATASVVAPEERQPVVISGGPPWPDVHRWRRRWPPVFEEAPPLSIAAFADGDIVIARAAISAPGQATTPPLPPLPRIAGRASGAFIAARAGLAKTGQAFAQVIPPLNADIARENEEIMTLIMVLSMDDDEPTDRLGK